MAYQYGEIGTSLPDQLLNRKRHRADILVGAVAMYELWTEEEVAVLRALAPRYDEIEAKLTGRSRAAIRVKCRQLGLPIDVHIWTGAEITKLRFLYRSAPKEVVLAAFSFSTWNKIKHAAWRNGIRRKKRPFKKVADPLMNAILERCAEIGWSLTDLDEECRTGRYFRERGWSRNNPNAKAVLRAIRILDGSVSVEWKN